MNEFAGILTERVVTESKPARKSSHAAACGTRAFIISHLARAALIEALSRSALFTTSRCDKRSAPLAQKGNASVIADMSETKVFIRVTVLARDDAPPC